MDNNVELQLKKILARLTKERGLSITALSRMAKVPLQTLHGWLQGSEPKSIRQVKKVADCLGVDLDYLCFGIEPVKDSTVELLEEKSLGVFEVILRRLTK